MRGRGTEEVGQGVAMFTSCLKVSYTAHTVNIMVGRQIPRHKQAELINLVLFRNIKKHNLYLTAIMLGQLTEFYG